MTQSGIDGAAVQECPVLTRPWRLVICLSLASLGVAGCDTYRAWRYPCASREPGLRGETKLGPDGKMLYFNGECWTGRPMPPTDTPF